jgi:hypothetical protein
MRRLSDRSARTGFQSLLCGVLFAFHEQRPEVISYYAVAVESIQAGGPGEQRAVEQLKAKHRPFLNGYAILGEERQVDFYRERAHRIAFLDAVKEEASHVAVVGKSLIGKMHCSPLPQFAQSREGLQAA